MKVWICSHTMRCESMCNATCALREGAEGLKHQRSFFREIGCSPKMNRGRRVRGIFPFVFSSLACFSLTEATENLWRSHKTVPFLLDVGDPGKHNESRDNPIQRCVAWWNGGQGQPPSWLPCSTSLTDRSAIINPTTPDSLEDALHFQITQDFSLTWKVLCEGK